MEMKQGGLRGLIFDRNKKQEKRKRVGNGLNGTESTCAVSSVFNSGIFVVVKVPLGQVYLRFISVSPCKYNWRYAPYVTAVQGVVRLLTEHFEEKA
jgi:hypothetical protein